MPTRKYLDETGLEKTLEEIRDHMPDISTKQDTLVSGTNIKTVNNQSILGSGNLDVGGSAVWGGITGTLSNQTDLQVALNGKQDIIQVSTMPTASIDTLNNIIQYIGTTDSTYTNGFFYKGISTTEEIEGVETTTYSWKQIDVSSNLVTLSYGHSTWQDFIDAYNAGKIVYCKAGSGVDPSTGAQRRMAFMAYINVSGSTLTSVEFQYYRSIGPHTASQQGDQVIRYLLNSSNGGTWTVDTRDASTKIMAGTGLTSTYSNGTLTLSTRGSDATSLYWINFNDIPSGQEVTDNTILTKFNNMLNDYNSGKTVLLENRLSTEHNVVELYIASQTYTVSGVSYLAFDSITTYFNKNAGSDAANGYTTSSIGYSTLTFNYGTKKPSYYYTAEHFKYIDPTVEYSPFIATQNWQPATKKYVDDNIPDVSNFITNTVNNLTNYYLKTETYTKTEVDNLISAVSSLDIQVVQTLPVTDISTSTIYLVPKASSQTQNVYDEYIYISDGASTPTYSWEKIGDTEIDLSDYVTTTDLSTALADYTTTTDLTTLLSGKQDTIDSSHKLSADLVDDSSATNKFVTASDKTAWNNKYDKPSGGIPDTDLSSSVQTSLGKADTALQSETDPVFSASAASGITSSDITSWNNKSDFSGSYNDLTDKPTIPDELSDLSDDSTHRLVTDTEKTTWNGKQDVIQYSTMPTASSSTVGKIVQYTGITTNDYTNGYFYICVDNSGTYSWENINVQDNAGNAKYILTANIVGTEIRNFNTTANKEVMQEIVNNIDDISLDKILLKCPVGNYYFYYQPDAIKNFGYGSTLQLQFNNIISTSGSTTDAFKEVGSNYLSAQTNNNGIVTSLLTYWVQYYLGRNTSKIEQTYNKVTSISSSSTDAQYPTAKCVYDAIPNIEACTNSDIDGLFNS